MTDYDGFEPSRLEHMKMIQGVVGRLAGNSFVVKGWAITLTAAFIGFSLNFHNAWLAAAGFVPAVAFWGIDAYYLKSERLFRALFDQVRTKDENVEPFAMGATGKSFVGRVKRGETMGEGSVASWWETAKRPTLSVFYGSLIVANAIVLVIVCFVVDSA